jgi:hypothetical protein
MAIDPNVARRIRNLIPDLDAVFGDAENEFLFPDQAIEDFYLDGESNVKWAAGLAKIVLGSSEALISKKIKNYETSTDGPAVAKELRIAGEGLVAEGKAQVALLGYEDFATVYFGSDVAIPEGATRTYWSLGWV